MQEHNKKVIVNATMLRAAQIVAAKCASGSVAPFRSSLIIFDTDGSLYVITQQCAFKAPGAFGCYDLHEDADLKVKVMSKPFLMNLSHLIDTKEDDITLSFDFPEEDVDYHEGLAHLSDTMGNPSDQPFFGISLLRTDDCFAEKFAITKQMFEDFGFDASETRETAPQISTHLFSVLGECGDIPARLLPPIVEPTTFEASKNMARVTIPCVGQFLFKSKCKVLDNPHSFESEQPDRLA